MIKAIIFDWGRTLFDNENDTLFPQVKDILDYLSKKYKLAIVSLAKDGNIERRQKIIKENDLEKYFHSVLFNPLDKDSLYPITLQKLKLTVAEVIIVDDRVVRGIRWGKKNGALTIWLRKGKFSHEEPNEETGMPTHVIHELQELLTLL